MKSKANSKIKIRVLSLILMSNFFIACSDIQFSDLNPTAAKLEEPDYDSPNYDPGNEAPVDTVESPVEEPGLPSPNNPNPNNNPITTVPDPTPAPTPIPGDDDVVVEPTPVPGDDDPTPIPTPSPQVKKVDILIIVDTSLSMRDNLMSFYRKMSNPMGELSGLDYRIGVTTTNIGSKYELNGKLIDVNLKGDKFITKDTKHKNDTFFDAVSFDNCTLGEFDEWLSSPCTIGNEKTMDVTSRALNANDSFYRADAELVVIYIQDQDEVYLEGETPKTSTDVLRTFGEKWGDSKRLKAFGIIVEPGDEKCLDKQNGYTTDNADYGRQVSDLVSKTGGSTMSICSDNYNGLFSGIAD